MNFLKILENQRISKKKQDQILETTQRGFIGIALRNEEFLKSNEQLKEQLDEVLKELNAIKEERKKRKLGRSGKPEALTQA